MYNYFAVQSWVGDVVAWVSVYRAPVGYGWDHERAEIYCARGFWASVTMQQAARRMGKRHKRGYKFKSHANAMRALKRAAFKERLRAIIGHQHAVKARNAVPITTGSLRRAALDYSSRPIRVRRPKKPGVLVMTHGVD